MRHLTRTLALTLALLTPAFAGDVTPSTQGDTLTITGTELIRYQVDPSTNTVTLPGSRVKEGSSFPDTVVWVQRGPDLVVTLPAGARLSLSPDGKRLSVALASTAAVTAPSDERAPVFVSLSNAAPATVASLLTSLYGNIRVQVDERQRALLVLVNPADKDLILSVIRMLDQERPQVMFEAEILEVNQDTTQALGISYDSIFTLKLSEGDNGTLTKIGKIGRGPLSLSIGINALKANGAARVLAQPRVTTLDGVEARINSTQTTPLIVPGSNGTQSVQNITTGITLRMTPKVAPDGTVEANLTISVSAPTGTTSQGVPQFSSREASTTVRVKNGEPIAIGGLLETRHITGTQKVPILGDIPIIGALFTNTRTETRHTDLVIVVTPRLVFNTPSTPGTPPK